MSKRSFRFTLLAAALIALAAAWEVVSPWWTLKGMRDAARARDSERLASYIDFPRVRSDLRDQLIGLAGKKLPVPGYEAFVRRYGSGRIIDPIVDVIVSPEALRVALLIAPRSSAGGSGPAAKRTCGMKRESLGRFRVRCARLPNGEADLVFERSGFGWRLVGVDLPGDYGSAVPEPTYK